MSERWGGEGVLRVVVTSAMATESPSVGLDMVIEEATSSWLDWGSAAVVVGDTVS